MRAMTDLMNLIKLNFLVIVCSLPVLTIGASLSAMHYVLYQMADGGEGKIASVFLREWRRNIRQTLPVTVMYLLILGLSYMEYNLVHPGENARRYVLVFIYAVILMLAFLYVWIAPLSGKFVFSTKGLLYNALYLTVHHMGRTLAMVAIAAVLVFVLTQDARLLPLWFIVGISLPSYFCTLIYHPVLKQMIEENPE